MSLGVNPNIRKEMHSYKDGRPTKVRWHDCGFEQASLCIVPEPDASFAYTDGRCLQACGVGRTDEILS